jgi:hypothetical protein
MKTIIKILRKQYEAYPEYAEEISAYESALAAVESATTAAATCETAAALLSSPKTEKEPKYKTAARLIAAAQIVDRGYTSFATRLRKEIDTFRKAPIDLLTEPPQEVWEMIKEIHSSITIGKRLAKLAQGSATPIPLTSDYWGSKLWHDGKAYFVLSYVGGYGGMQESRRKVPASELKNCSSLRELQELLKPTNDNADGDPMGYTPRDVRPCEIDLEKAGI